MKKKIVIFVLILVVILLVVFGVVFSINKAKENQMQTIKTFYSYINEQKYEEMYEMLSKESKNNFSKEDFITRNKNIYEGIGTASLEINNLEITGKEGKTINLSYNEKFYTTAGEVNFNNSAQIIKEDEEYKINWSSKLIFPELEENYKVRISTLKAKRGSILDRNGKELAYDGSISQVGIVPGKLGDDKEGNVSKISELLDVSVEKINNLLGASYVKDDTFVPVKKISKNSPIKEQLLQIPGILINNIDGRVYDLGEEAAHLIGYIQPINEKELESHEGQNYTSSSLIGKSGLEYAYEEKLRGIDGAEIYIENEKGDRVKTIITQEKKDGESVQTTIDLDLQKSFYDQMKNDKGFFVVMNPETGEVLALVSTPSFDSNEFILGMTNERWNFLNEDENKPLYNRFKQSYCPGSTFKPITALIGLSEGVIDSSTEFNYSGTSWQKDKSWGDYFITTLTEYNEAKNVENALIRSDNIFFAQLALKIGENKFSEKLDELNFGANLDFPITLKASQYINKDSKFTEAKLANSGYGQGDVLVNPIHMASIYSMFVNNGSMIKPYLEFKYDIKPEYIKENVFSSEAIEKVKTALTKVVETPQGTAYDAKIQGLTMLGKTGTAELKQSKDDTESGTLGWFNCITLNREDGNLLIVGMVENVQNNTSGGSHYVISKIKSILNK